MHGTFTAKLATVKKDGSPRVVPIWFVLDGRKDQARKRIGDIVFTTYDSSLKALNIKRDNRVSICVVDQTPPVFVCNYSWYCKNSSSEI